MIDEFTFITVTFNHDRYITNHLESIKYQIETFGRGIRINYLLIDDASSDGTKQLVNQWFESNPGLFKNVELIFKNKNKGTVDSLRVAIERTRTKYFKVLAGDDYFYKNNIFEIFDSVENRIVITPCILIGNVPSQSSDYLVRQFNMLKFIRKYARYFLTWENFIQAPGAFWEYKNVNTLDLLNYVSKYRLIEDYPLWRFLTEKCNYEIYVIDKPYVCYRIGSGVSTTNPNKLFLEDIEMINKVLKPKTAGNSLKSKIHRLIMKTIRFVANIRYINYCYPNISKKVNND